MQALLSVRQVAALLGVCAATVYRMCEQRVLPHFRVQNAIRMDILEVKDAFQGAGHFSTSSARTINGSTPFSMSALVLRSWMSTGTPLPS